MTEQEKREKVIKGLEHEIGRTELEWLDCVEVALLKDALELLKAQEPRVMTLEEAKMQKQDYQNLRECPFCGGKKLVRSVDGGILPSFIDADKQDEIFEKTPYVTSCELFCELCGARVEGYAASNNLHDDLYEKAIKNCYEKWNRRADDAKQ